MAPDPDAWRSLVAKVNQLDRSGEPSWSKDRIAALRIPTLLILGDADVVRREHTVEMFRLLGGGVAGDIVELPPAQLAILPGTSHEGMLNRIDWLSSMILPSCHYRVSDLDRRLFEHRRPAHSAFRGWVNPDLIFVLPGLSADLASTGHLPQLRCVRVAQASITGTVS